MSTPSSRILSFQTRGLDRIPLWTASWRKWITFQHVSSQNSSVRERSLQDYIARWTAIQSSACRSKELREMTTALWKMESLGAAFGKRPPRGCTLAAPSLPLEIRPIAHVGMGVAAVAASGFDPAKIGAMIESLAHPDFRLFSYESMGAMMGVYEMPVPKIFVGLESHRRPEPVDFIRSFPAEIQRLISHGYGRILYFNSLDLATAVRRIAERSYLDAATAVHGMAFAYAMINHADFWLALDTGGGFEDAALRAAFANGLVYALEFWEWAAPGFLRSLQPRSRRSAKLIENAQREIDTSLARGALSAFLVENPVEYESS